MTDQDSDPVDYRFRVIRANGDVSQEEITSRLATSIRIIVGSPRTFRHQLVALALVELLARLFPRIIIDLDKSTPTHTAIPGPRALANLLDEARHRGHPAEPAESPAITISIAATDEQADIYVDASGWQSYVGSETSKFAAGADALIAIGPLCAAARAAARVFHVCFDGLLADEPTPDSLYWSALTYAVSSSPIAEPDLPAPHDLHALLVGAGSVGGAAVYALRFTPDLAGEIAIVDPQMLEDRNYVKAILASFADSQAKLGKAEVAQSALSVTKLNCDPQPTTIADYVAARPRTATLPLVLSSVDSIESRRSIQDCLPLELIDAACDHERARVSGHVTDDGPCVYCLYIERVLEAKAIRARLIANATGFSPELVAELLVVDGRTLTDEEISAIETHREKSPGAYAAYAGQSLAKLYEQELLYGETPLGTGGDVAVASPFVTALAGFLLAGEALKAGSDQLAEFRLGARGSLVAVGGGQAVKYEEPLLTPTGALLQTVPRSVEPACLCNSPRRLALLQERHHLQTV